MKRLLSVVFAICAPVVLAFTLASQVAMASCITILCGSTPNGGVFCELTGEDARWCYYNCTCDGDCTDIYNQLGLIDP